MTSLTHRDAAVGVDVQIIDVVVGEDVELAIAGAGRSVRQHGTACVGVECEKDGPAARQPKTRAVNTS